MLGRDAFDFWIGTWDCAFDGGHAVNRVSRELGGRVIVERFEIDAPEPWSGRSVSVFHEPSQRWQQTWVDQDGSYWHFLGGLVDGSPSFGTPTPVDDPPLLKRMVFTDLADDAFHWRWESSADGAAWQVTWEIDYTRRMP